MPGKRQPDAPQPTGDQDRLLGYRSHGPVDLAECASPLKPGNERAANHVHVRMP